MARLRDQLPSPTSQLNDRRAVLVAGVALFAFGGFLIWDATERRGKRLPWPVSQFTPF